MKYLKDLDGKNKYLNKLDKNRKVYILSIKAININNMF